ncbi:uncharacterized protein LOC131994187 isoform X2 [Stomoxys calcitrans]|uniref:uncharacterized protein LOC131994187 isoform X2 n=1 Tax=Stomoxys calcitrans TaxID=35570 RepID=UPI0027E273B7|nr:uncharacterized protein LOC131994187 isoform X2 [Stomoxys calcitrans]
MADIIKENVAMKECPEESLMAKNAVKGEGDEKNESETYQEQFLKDLEKESVGSERKSKTSSLKKLFRLPTKKSLEKSGVPSGQDNLNMNQDPNDGEGEDEMVSGSVSGEKRLNRVRLRLEGIYRHDSKSKMNLDSSASQMTLKSSLSNVWNNVFKKKKSKPESDDVMKTNVLGSNDECRHSLEEDMHALEITEDPNEH